MTGQVHRRRPPTLVPNGRPLTAGATTRVQQCLDGLHMTRLCSKVKCTPRCRTQLRSYVGACLEQLLQHLRGAQPRGQQQRRRLHARLRDALDERGHGGGGAGEAAAVERPTAVRGLGRGLVRRRHRVQVTLTLLEGLSRGRQLPPLVAEDHCATSVPVEWSAIHLPDHPISAIRLREARVPEHEHRAPGAGLEVGVPREQGVDSLRVSGAHRRV
mmetsp:Transcript_174097/g.558200  ORF Transcript_174097/g.558200 Transcript_174097/m.558200 type:complete len:215 (-) Transcript_174097:3065-3709(-)